MHLTSLLVEKINEIRHRLRQVHTRVICYRALKLLIEPDTCQLFIQKTPLRGTPTP